MEGEVCRPLNVCLGDDGVTTGGVYVRVFRRPILKYCSRWAGGLWGSGMFGRVCMYVKNCGKNYSTKCPYTKALRGIFLGSGGARGGVPSPWLC